MILLNNMFFMHCELLYPMNFSAIRTLMYEHKNRTNDSELSTRLIHLDKKIHHAYFRTCYEFNNLDFKDALYVASDGRLAKELLRIPSITRLDNLLGMTKEELSDIIATYIGLHWEEFTSKVTNPESQLEGIEYTEVDTVINNIKDLFELRDTLIYLRGLSDVTTNH